MTGHRPRWLRINGRTSSPELRGVALGAAAYGLDLTIRRRRVRGPARPLRLRQVDRAELPGRAAAADRRQHLARRHADGQRAAGAARLRHGVPELRAVPAHVGARATSRFGLRMRGVPQGRDRAAASTRRCALVQLDRARRQAARPALRRPAAAGGDRPRDRARAAAGADGRAAVQPGRQAAAGDAHRDPAACTRRSASPPSTSPTTRRRRCRWPTASWCCATGEVAADRHARGAAHRPANRHVAGFMGYRNLLRLPVDRAGRRPATVVRRRGDGDLPVPRPATVGATAVAAIAAERRRASGRGRHRTPRRVGDRRGGGVPGPRDRGRGTHRGRR